MVPVKTGFFRQYVVLAAVDELADYVVSLLINCGSTVNTEVECSGPVFLRSELVAAYRQTCECIVVGIVRSLHLSHEGRIPVPACSIAHDIEMGDSESEAVSALDHVESQHVGAGFKETTCAGSL